MLKIEMLTVETVGALKPLLLELADYHNQTALNFRGLPQQLRCVHGRRLPWMGA